MKKTLLSILFLSSLTSFSQNQFAFGFGGTTAAMLTAGWVQTNQSTSPSTTALWSIASYTAVTVSATVPATPFQNQTYAVGQTCPIPNGQDGTPNTFSLVNYSSTTSTLATGATISNWLISPAITVQNGDVVSFYSRKGTSGTTDYPDRLELRMSSAATHVNPTGGATGVGSFTTVGVTVNPTLVAGFIFPQVWTQYSYTVSGLTGATSVKFGFRYFVTDGGTNGANSDIIGIDTFSVDRALGTSDFFKNHFTVFPNPSNDVVNISNTDATAITSISVSDINGRIVKEVTPESNSFSIKELNSGVYILKIATAEGIGTSRIIKN